MSDQPGNESLAPGQDCRRCAQAGYNHGNFQIRHVRFQNKRAGYDREDPKGRSNLACNAAKDEFVDEKHSSAKAEFEDPERHQEKGCRGIGPRNHDRGQERSDRRDYDGLARAIDLMRQNNK